MKLEFLPDGSDDCPLVRLYDFAPHEAAGLVSAALDLASGRQRVTAVHDWPGVEAIDGCRLLLRSGPRDRGLVRLAAPADFECVLTPATWDDVAGLTEPFIAGCGGFRWLSEIGDARWLISGSGHW
jgi:hypothetical protein